jgi:ABC-type nitrate/sulfonate/bicarbonate transport system substrate-binding protein
VVALALLVAVGVLGTVAVLRMSSARKRRAAEEAAARAEKEPKRPARPRGQLVVGAGDTAAIYPAVLANDGLRPGPASAFRAAGISVEIKIVRGARERLAAFDAGLVDVLVLPLEAYATIPREPNRPERGLVSFFVASVGQGHLGIAAIPRVRTIAQLVEERAAAPRTPGLATFYRALARRAGSTAPPPAGLVATRTVAQAADALRRGEVEAALLPARELEALVAEPKAKARVLVTTRSAGRLAPEVLFARRELVEERPEELARFVEAWLAGGARLVADPKAAAAVLARHLEEPESTVAAAMARLRPTTLAEAWLYLKPAPRTLFDELVDLAVEAARPAEGTPAAHEPFEGGARTPRVLERLSPPEAPPPNPTAPSSTAAREGGRAPLLVRAVTLRFVPGPDGISDQLAPDADPAELGAIADLFTVFDRSAVTIAALADTELISMALAKRRVASLVRRLDELPTRPSTRVAGVVREIARRKVPDDAASARAQQPFEVSIFAAE